MKTTCYLVCVFILIASYGVAQTGSINSKLESIPTSDDDELNSPIGEPGFLWACAATIKMPDFEEHNNITYLEVLPGKGILVATRAGDIWCLSPDDLSVIWKNKLHSEHIIQLKPSPTGSTFAVTYSSAKAYYKSVEIRSGADGSLLHAVTRITPYKCGYNAEFLKDTYQNTTLTAWEVVYSPDGKRVAVWYNNHGPNLECQAIELEEIIIVNTQTGDIEAVREGFIWDFWTRNGVKRR